MAGKCIALPMYRIRRDITTAVFCYQLVYNIQRH